MSKPVDNLETRFDHSLPTSLIDPHVRQRLHTLARHLDGLARRDEKTKSVFLDEGAFRAMLSEFKAYLPPGFERTYITRMKALPDNKLVAGANLTPLTWHELVASVPSLQGYWQAPTHVASLTHATSLEELHKNLQGLAPQIKEAVFDPATFKQNFEHVLNSLGGEANRETTIAQTSLSDVWDCFVNHWGWWGAALAVAAIIAIGTALGIFGSWTVVLGAIVIGVVNGYLLAAILGLGGVAGVLLACIFGNW